MYKKFHLSTTDKKLGGVCGGLAQYFDIDPLLIRIAFLILFFNFSIGFWAYIILWIIAPKEN